MLTVDMLDPETVVEIHAIYSEQNNNAPSGAKNEALFEKMNYKLGGATGTPSDKKKELCYLWDTNAKFAAQKGDLEEVVVSLEIAASVAGDFSKEIQSHYLDRLRALRNTITKNDDEYGREIRAELDKESLDNEWIEILRNGDFDALLTFAKRIKVAPNEEQLAFENVGTALYFQNRKDLAAVFWELGASAGQARCEYLLGELFLENGDVETGKQHYDNALKMGYEYAKRRLAELATNDRPNEKMPPPFLIRSWEDAENVCLQWMIYWGFTDARLTQRGSDGGIDVESTNAVAQVKFTGSPIGRESIQKLYGAATALRKKGLFFAISGYTSQALDFASTVKMPLFQFNLQGEPHPINDPARLYPHKS